MIALDTNVFLYACDKAEPRRQRIAIDLIASSRNGVLLWQVACEFVAASRKLSTQGFLASDAWNRLADFLAIFPLVLPTGRMLERGRELHTNRGVSFWDAMILSACMDAGVETLYSEDVPGLTALGTLKVVNPFN